MNPETYSPNYDHNQTFNSSYNPDLDEQRIRRLKVTLVSIGVVLIIILLAISIYIRLTSGGILVTTNSGQNSISVTRSLVVNGTGKEDENTATPTPETLTNNKKTKLATGTYILSVNHGSTNISQVVTIKSGHVSKYTVNLPASLSSPELVANVNAATFTVGDSNIYYVDQGTKNLYSVNNQNNLSQLNDVVTFQTINWADGAFGIGEDTSGNFYSIDNGSVMPISTPQHDTSKPAVYAVAPDHTFYLVTGKNIYKKTGVATYQKIYTANNAPTAIAAGNNLIALDYNPGDGSTTQNQASVTILADASKQVESKIDADSISWSPSGKYLLTTSDAYTQIFDDSLNSVAIVPNQSLDSVTWLSDSSLIFSNSNQLWKYDLASQQSQTVAAAPQKHLIGLATVNPDKSYVYMAVESSSNSNSDLMIERYGLKNQVSPTFIDTLQSNLPWLTGRCLLSLVNFGSPPTVESYGGQPEDNCPLAAQSYVQQLGVNPALVNYQITNVPPDEPTSQ